VRLQYFGLAGDFRFVSIRVDRTWHVLPFMRDTSNPVVRACFEGKASKGLRAEDCRPLKHAAKR
jgi:hypothetical protein